jgi:acyl-CoA dehydrogenase
MLTIVFILVFLILGYTGAPLIAWSIALFALLAATSVKSVVIWTICAVIAVIFNVRPLRRTLVSSAILKLMGALKVLPKISATERAALKAGDVWVEKELFSGKPDFDFIRKQPYPELTPEERAFLDGPVEQLCKMTHDWDVFQKGELPQEVWDFLKKERFFGMIIPKSYGGLGFSALAHSEVIMKLNSRCSPLAITTMVPNSLGPAELLVHYGTEEQKNYYLPRLARGEEIPCFALTEPEAGSDAGSLQANGVVFKGDDGKLYLKLNWNKRWITLAAVSTVMGLAFRLRDPDKLLGGEEDRGITCALIPSNTPGVTANRRHNPLNVPFYNSPTQGKDVVVPITAIIGGPAQAGNGWTMLMESLAAGRGISLPSQSTGSAKTIARVASAHALVRRQFGVSIGKFEGVAAPLARIGGFTYMLEALRKYTCGAIDQGRKPSIITAIAKYYSTEMSRWIVNDGMDIRAGAGISLGPKNMVAPYYFGLPISITVEGANIMTRSLIIFGQGAVRAHPYAYQEIEAAESGNVELFDRAFWGHVGHVVRNSFRALLLSLTRGWLAMPFSTDPLRKYYRRLAWSSARFALLSDLAMGSFGGNLKIREKITGRLADVLSWMYLACATLRRFEADGRPAADLPLLQWAMGHSFAEIQKAYEGLYGNFDVPLVGPIFRGPMRHLAAFNPIGAESRDHVDIEISEYMMTDGAQRERLLAGMYMPKDPKEPLASLEQAFRSVNQADATVRKIQHAVRKKILVKQPMHLLIGQAVEKQVITAQQAEALRETEALRREAIQVDDFPLHPFPYKQ